MAKKKAPKEGPGEAIHSTTIRVPLSIWQEFELDAEENSRTANMHVVHLIKERVKQARAEKIRQQ